LTPTFLSAVSFFEFQSCRFVCESLFGNRFIDTMSSIVFDPAPPTVTFDNADLFKGLASEHWAVCFCRNLGEYVRVADDISDNPFLVRSHELYPRIPMSQSPCEAVRFKAFHKLLFGTGHEPGILPPGNCSAADLT